MDRSQPFESKQYVLGGFRIYNLLYMEYDGDIVHHSIHKYWYEIGTKFDDCGSTFFKLGTKYNPEVSKYRP